MWDSFEKLSESNWTIRFNNSCTDNEFQTFLTKYKFFLENIEKKIIINFDFTRLQNITIKQTILLISFLNKIKSLHKKKLEHFLLIIKTPVIKQLTDFIFTLSPPVVGYSIKYIE